MYFEGGLYGQTGMDQFEARVMFAAERLVHRAPTVARMLADRAALDAVAAYDTETRRIEVARPESLRSWTERWQPR